MLEKSLWNVSSKASENLSSRTLPSIGEEQVAAFLGRLTRFTHLDVDVKVNDNRSTMLSLLAKKGGKARLSLHHMFLDAPDSVVCAIAHYVMGKRSRGLDVHKTLRAYIQQHLPLQDYSHRLKPSQLRAKGAVYDLQELYHQINKEYFSGQLKLHLTWYGQAPLRRSKRVRRITYGLYVDALKLIKIHRILDDPFFPPYFVKFVIYHEMLHAVVPGQIDDQGRFCVHTPLFKKKERCFAEYAQAMAWEKNNTKTIFCYGWT